MNAKTIETNWAELKGKIKSKWDKFSDTEIDGLKGDLSQLAGKILTVYGITKDQADRQYEDFKSSVQSLIGQDYPTVFAFGTLPKPNLVTASQAAKTADPVDVKDGKVG